MGFAWHRHDCTPGTHLANRAKSTHRGKALTMVSKVSKPWRIDGRLINVSSLDKVFWPEDGLTKGDMLGYYKEIAPTLLPYLRNRPVTLRVFPNGIHNFSYYRRDLPDNAPAWMRSVDYRPGTSEGTTRLPLVDDAAGLVWLANQGSIEFHLWASQMADLAQPDQVIFDLDPGDEASFTDVLQAALRLRDSLAQQGLRGYAKTSGGQGLHVYMPLSPGYSFDTVREWVKTLAEQLAASYPQLIAVAHGATHRGRLVTIDHAQNSIGRNTAAPYTLRALPGATVSTPLSWDEIEEGHVRPSDFTLRTVPDRLKQLGDIFSPVLHADQRLP